MLARLRWSAGAVIGVTALVVLFVVAGPRLFDTSAEVRFVPAVERGETFLELALFASVVWLAIALARRVGLVHRRRMIGRAVLLTFAQLGLVLSAEVAIFYSHGGFRLFEPHLVRSSTAPDGRVAHVYANGFFGCDYEVYVASPFALTMRRSLKLTRETCSEPAPRVMWEADGSPQLVDEHGARLEPQQLRPWSLVPSGC